MALRSGSSQTALDLGDQQTDWNSTKDWVLSLRGRVVRHFAIAQTFESWGDGQHAAAECCRYLETEPGNQWSFEAHERLEQMQRAVR